MICIATFYSHFGAIRFKKECEKQDWPAKIMPVPRTLSSSCGTCVHYVGECPDHPTPELERIVEVLSDGYRLLYRSENS